jgi:DivIVA domain-containing protein
MTETLNTAAERRFAGAGLEPFEPSLRGELHRSGNLGEPLSTSADTVLGNQRPQHARRACGPRAHALKPRKRRANFQRPGLVILLAVVEDKSPQTGQSESELLVPAEIRNVTFPGSRRGYDRGAVDAYVERVNRLIAELEVNRSPQAAVRHALERVGEQTSSLLQRARETAEEITASARQEADELSARAKAEAADLVVNARAEADGSRAEAEELVAKAGTKADEILARSKAEAEKILTRARSEAEALQEEAEARIRELQADTETIWEKRRELLHDMQRNAARLEEQASAAVARFPAPKPAEPAEEGKPEPEAEAETEPTGVAATDEPKGDDSGGRVSRRRDEDPPGEESK